MQYSHFNTSFYRQFFKTCKRETYSIIIFIYMFMNIKIHNKLQVNNNFC